MNTPITITPVQVLAVFLAFCSAVVTIAATVGIFTKIYNKAKEPGTTQNKRIEKLEADIIELRSYLNNDNRRIKSIEHGNRIILESLQVLIDHAIDGNNISELKSKSKDLNTYLYDKGFTDST